MRRRPVYRTSADTASHTLSIGYTSRVLKVTRISEYGDTHVFRVLEDCVRASDDMVRRLLVVAGKLLLENGLPGSFRAGAAGQIVLQIGSAGQAYFYDGILFAALDVLNDPNRNPTLFRLSLEED